MMSDYVKNLLASRLSERFKVDFVSSQYDYRLEQNEFVIGIINNITEQKETFYMSYFDFEENEDKAINKFVDNLQKRELESSDVLLFKMDDDSFIQEDECTIKEYEIVFQKKIVNCLEKNDINASWWDVFEEGDEEKEIFFNLMNIFIENKGDPEEITECICNYYNSIRKKVNDYVENIKNDKVYERSHGMEL